MTLLADQMVLPTVSTRPRRLHRYLVPSVVFADAGVIWVTLLLAVWGRLRIGMFDAPADVSAHAMMIGPLILGAWLAVIALTGGYRNNVIGFGADEFKRLLNASVLTAGLIGAVCYLAHFSLSRGFFFLSFAVGLPLLLVERTAVRTALRAARTRGKLLQRVLLVGTPGHVDEIVRVLHREEWLGYRVVGAVLPQGSTEDDTMLDLPVMGHVGNLVDLVRRSGVDIVVLAGGGVSSSDQMRRLVWEFERDTVKVVVAPSVTDICADRINIRPVGGLPLIHIDPPTYVRAARIGKRTFDLLGSLALLCALAPVFAIAALAIKRADGGPIMFKHTRIGRDGRPFDCLKLRTMVPDAESMIEDLQLETGSDALLFKLQDDPRITKPGKLLRRLSIDELPQLVNVVCGDMSLVGPRPQVAREVALYDDAMARRLHVRPGMTGLWQVSGRNDLTVDEAVRLDLYYVDNWSMVQDLDILRKTFSAVVSSRGAY